MERWWLLCLWYWERINISSFLWMSYYQVCLEHPCLHFGISVRPSSFKQYWMWLKWSLPYGKQMYMVGLAAVYAGPSDKKVNLFWKEKSQAHWNYMFDLFSTGILGRALEARGCSSDGTWRGSPEVSGSELSAASASRYEADNTLMIIRTGHLQ